MIAAFSERYLIFGEVVATTMNKYESRRPRRRFRNHALIVPVIEVQTIETVPVSSQCYTIGKIGYDAGHMSFDLCVLDVPCLVYLAVEPIRDVIFSGH
jgi:hypothetical protein